MTPISWQEFLKGFKWKQGEHVAAIAPSGAGKTTLIRELLPMRSYTIFFGTKPDDPLYRDMLRNGYRRIEHMGEVKPWDNKLMLWPKQRATIPETLAAQRYAFQSAMNTIVKQKAWTVVIDESKYLAEMLKLRTELTYCIEQLRSINATVICGAQRPSWLPPSVLANSTHTFLWKTTNREDAAKLSDLGGVDAALVRAEARTLDSHEFLYINTRGTDSQVLRSQVERKG